MMEQASIDKQYSDLMAESEPQLKLNRARSDDYLKEIILGGGAPSLLEIGELLSDLKTARQVSSSYRIKKLGRRAWSVIIDEEFEEDAVENKELKFA